MIPTYIIDTVNVNVINSNPFPTYSLVCPQLMKKICILSMASCNKFS